MKLYALKNHFILSGCYNAYVQNYGARTSVATCLSLPEYSSFDTKRADQFSHTYRHWV